MFSLRNLAALMLSFIMLETSLTMQLPGYKAYLPLIIRSPIQIGGHLYDEHIETVANGPVILHLWWSDAEPLQGVYVWPDLPDLPNKIILNIFGSPAWARTNPDRECSPPKPEYYQTYAVFAAAAALYYNAWAIEVWNEPDASDSPSPHYYGCFENGTQYGDFLEEVYPIIKQVDVIVIGGALSRPNNFWQLAMQAGALYDVVSVHHYEGYPNWNAMGAYEWIAHMNEVGEERPVWMTETALIKSGETNPSFEQAQADYFLRLPEVGFPFIAWHAISGSDWMNCDLYDNGRYKPAWYIYKDLSQ